MKYRITFRPINKSDISRECPFMPDFDEFKTHTQAIFEDIKVIEGVIEIAIQSNRELIIKTDGLDLNTLRLKLKLTLQQNFQYARLFEIELL